MPGRRLALIAALFSVAVTGCEPQASSAAGSASLRVTLQLNATTVTSGGQITGLLTITNRTGRALGHGAGLFFQVLLVNGNVQPDPGWLLRAPEAAIPTGTTTYPVVVRASYNQCTNPPTAHSPGCTASGGISRLPPGSYEAVTYLAAPVVPAPPPIRVEVLPA